MSDDGILKIEDVLEYYGDEVIPSLAAAIVIDDRFPEEVLNEIRNAMTHLARSHVSEGISEAKKQEELKAAKRHLKRVCLDALKVTLSVLAQRCEDAIEALTYDCQLPDDVYKKMSALRESRVKTTTHEGQDPTDSIIEKLKELVNSYDEFYCSLDDQFAGKTATMRRDARKKDNDKQLHKGLLFGFILGIIGSVIASFIWAYSLAPVVASSCQTQPAKNKSPQCSDTRLNDLLKNGKTLPTK